MIKVFYLLVLMHFLTDFVAQGETISSKKRGLNKYMLAHVAITTIGSGLVLSFFLNLIPLVIALIIRFSSHLIIDIVKEKITKKFPNLQWKFIGLGQMAHISILYLISIIFLK